MAGPRQQLARLHILAGRYEPAIARAIKRALRRLDRNVDAKALERALRRRDTRAVQRALNLDTFHLRETKAGIEGSYVSAVTVGLEELPPTARIAIDLDRANPRAVKYFDTAHLGLIREISEETRVAVRDIVRMGFTDRLPVIEQSKRIREIVGLTKFQSRAVYNFRKQLEVQADLWPGAHPKIRPAAKRRLSATEQAEVKRHFREGHLGQRGIDRLVKRYRESLTNLRAQSLGRTETIRASNVSQMELWQQAADDGLIERERTWRRWVATMDDRVRPEHAAANGQEVPFDEPFVVDGEQVMYPPAAPNCRCGAVLVFRDAA